LLLREFDEGDAAAFYVLGSDPAIIRYTGGVIGSLTGIEHAREVLLSHPLADYRKHGFGRWACVQKQSGQVIGFSGLKYLDELEEVDIGYRFLPAYWGMGLATESGAAVLDYGFTHLKLQRIIGLVDPENAASIRVLLKLGLTYAGMVKYMGDAAKYVIEAGRPSAP
jgi:RimJ/RimL family protein N-acetyltransferase